ncbi:MAG TPA: HAMP domain-containing sensor histidine kinase, partial [Candidatus Paceibacterota bacterium]|nr:HAMP domain-containing sensor histidine kinase [Candidatus Paceibacterota bacterium]
DTAKNEFISLASHQMRTPLTAINWYSEMLLGGDAGELNAKQKEYFNAIYAAGQQMNEIIKTFLHILRLEAGSIAMNAVPVDLSGMVRSTIEESGLAIDKKHLRVSEQVQEALPLPKVDPELARVILQNLISNAVKYTPEKGEVTVSLEKVAQGSSIAGRTAAADSVLVSVRDTGIGIAEADRDKISTKFFRAENAKTWDPNGNGLGLYMTDRMIRTARGALWFTSEVGKGTTFYALLPIGGE